MRTNECTRRFLKCFEETISIIAGSEFPRDRHAVPTNINKTLSTCTKHKSNILINYSD